MRHFKCKAATLFFAWLLPCVTPVWPQQSAKSEASGAGSFVQVQGGKLYYEECGSGEARTIVLIHDGIAHSAVWDDVWPAFCKKFHTVRYDRRGYGRSPETTAPYWETEGITALLRHMRIARTILVGSSHGGELSIDFTLQHPEMVEQLVLVGAVVSGCRTAIIL